MILPLDVTRCWGSNGGSRVCPKRDQCARFIGRHDHDEEAGRYPLSTDRMCILSFHAFIDANERKTK